MGRHGGLPPIAVPPPQSVREVAPSNYPRDAGTPDDATLYPPLCLVGPRHLIRLGLGGESAEPGSDRSRSVTFAADVTSWKSVPCWTLIDQACLLMMA